jgi:hypothetical protein
VSKNSEPPKSEETLIAPASLSNQLVAISLSEGHQVLTLLLGDHESQKLKR